MNKIIKTFMVMAVAAMALPALCRANVDPGAPAPDFTLSDSNNQQRSLSDYQGKYVVLEWFNPECPFVKRHYSTSNMQNLQEKYTKQDVVWLTIDSSAPGKQGHLNAEQAAQFIQQNKTQSTALLLDPKGDVGRLYGAQTTPHIFIINPEGTLIYQGAIDDVPSTDPGDVATAKNYVDTTLSAALKGEVVSAFSTKSYGCSVKY